MFQAMSRGSWTLLWVATLLRSRPFFSAGREPYVEPGAGAGVLHLKEHFAIRLASQNDRDLANRALLDQG